MTEADPFDEPWWNLLQTVGWVGFRERNLVWRCRDGVMEDCQIQPLNGDDEAWAASKDESLSQLSLDALAVEFARRNPVALCTFEEAEAAVIAALREKRLSALAFQNGRETEIPVVRWVQPLFWSDPYLSRHDSRRCRTIPWQEIRFPREQVLTLWPGVSESCLRDGAESHTPAMKKPKREDRFRLRHQLVQRQGETVWVAEGEMCADVLTKLGILTTTSGSASSASSTCARISKRCQGRHRLRATSGPKCCHL